MGINPTEIHRLIPRIRTERIRKLLDANNMETTSVTSRSRLFKDEEVVDLAEQGFGLVAISILTGSHTDHVREYLTDNGYYCVTGSGVYKTND